MHKHVNARRVLLLLRPECTESLDNRHTYATSCHVRAHEHFATLVALREMKWVDGQENMAVMLICPGRFGVGCLAPDGIWVRQYHKHSPNDI